MNMYDFGRYQGQQFAAIWGSRSIINSCINCCYELSSNPVVSEYASGVVDGLIDFLVTKDDVSRTTQLVQARN
jgi:hypothetical protein